MSIDTAPPHPRFFTVGVIAEQLGVPAHRVCYVLHTRRHIRPSGWAGAARVFDREAVTLIQYELRKITRRNRRRRRGGAR